MNDANRHACAEPTYEGLKDLEVPLELCPFLRVRSLPTRD